MKYKTICLYKKDNLHCYVIFLRVLWVRAVQDYESSLFLALSQDGQSRTLSQSCPWLWVNSVLGFESGQSRILSQSCPLLWVRAVHDYESILFLALSQASPGLWVRAVQCFDSALSRTLNQRCPGLWVRAVQDLVRTVQDFESGQSRTLSQDSPGLWVRADHGFESVQSRTLSQGSPGLWARAVLCFLLGSPGICVSVWRSKKFNIYTFWYWARQSAKEKLTIKPENFLELNKRQGLTKVGRQNNARSCKEGRVFSNSTSNRSAQRKKHTWAILF